MAKHSVQVKLNDEGVCELLKRAPMQKILSSAAQKKAAEAGEGYAAAVHTGKNRAYANVFPETKEAYFDNLENNTLEKVIRT